MPETNFISDEELFARARSGSEPAFSMLYDRWCKRIYRFALQMSGSQAVAEETVQEVFLALIRSPDLFDPDKGSLAMYIFGIARNLVWRSLKKEKIFVPLTDEHNDLESDVSGPLSRMDEARQVEELRKAILRLPKDSREAVVLCDLQEFTYEQAAQVLECPVGTVRSRLHRARRQLIRNLKKQDGTQDENSATIVGRISYDLP